MDTADCERGTKRKYSGDNNSANRVNHANHVNHVRPRVPPSRDDTASACHPSSGRASALPFAFSSSSPDSSRRHEELDGDLDVKEQHYAALYLKELDFRSLGEQDEELKVLMKGEAGSHLDFTDPLAVMQLTKTLLKLDFGLRIELPLDRLCPPVPNRHNYILWLKDLLDSSSTTYSETYDPGRRVTGLDVGTGASLIYPLLACAQRPAWSFIATDVDGKSLDYARRNVELNAFQSRIQIVGRDVAAPLVPLDELGLGGIDFVMVNPPFYTSESELLDLSRKKAHPPNSACTGAPIEMVCEGGEIGFVRRIIDESLVLRGRVQWYTSMLGKQSSLDVLIGKLRDSKIDNYAVTAFVQGNRTRRWALAWSFNHRRPSIKAIRGFEPTAGKRILPLPTELTALEDDLPAIDLKRLETALCKAMETLDLVSWKWNGQISRGIGFADGNVWSRAYRRKKERQHQTSAEPLLRDGHHPSAGKTPTGISDCPFGFAISLRRGRSTNDTKGRVKVAVRWLQGRDYALFESFAGMLRKVFLGVTNVYAVDKRVDETRLGWSTVETK